MLNGNAVGNLGKDPRFNTTKNDRSVCNFSVAARIYGSDEPVWLKCTAWGKTAELIDKHFSKGDRIAVTGRLKLDTWVNKDDQEVTELAMDVVDFDFAGGGEKKASRDEGRGGGGRSKGRGRGRSDDGYVQDDYE